MRPMGTVSLPGSAAAGGAPAASPQQGSGNAAPVDRNIKIGVLRIDDIYFAGVNAEIYSEIGMHLKTASPANKTIVVALANGGENGYIQSDNAHSYVTPGSLQMPAPACEEGKIISAAVELIKRSGN
jgi:hypothetical protein